MTGFDETRSSFTQLSVVTKWITGKKEGKKRAKWLPNRITEGRFLPFGEGGAGENTACVALWIRRALVLWFAARGVFPFAECSCQKLVLGRRCDWTSALCRRAGSRGMAGNCAHEAIVPLILLPNEGEPVGSECLPPETPSKAAGSREPGSAQPCFALWRAWGRGDIEFVVLIFLP